MRFTHDNVVFRDAARVLGPFEASEHLLVIPEVSTAAGRLDYVLAKFDTVQRALEEFCVLEVMTVSTTTTGDVLRSLHDTLNERAPTGRYKYGINWRQVVSRMIVQVLAKAWACERWGKTMIWALQDVLYDFMLGSTTLEMADVQGDWSRSSQRILLLIYTLDTSSTDLYRLRLASVKAGTKEHLARVLEPSSLPSGQTFRELLAGRIAEQQNVFDLTSDPLASLATVASRIVRHHEGRED